MTARARRRLVFGTAGLCLAWLVTTGCAGCDHGEAKVQKKFKNITELGDSDIYVGSYAASTSRSVLIRPRGLQLVPIYAAGKELAWKTIQDTGWEYLPPPAGWTFNSEGQCVQQGPLAPATGTSSAQSHNSQYATSAQPAFASPQYAPQSPPLLYKAGATTNTVVVLDPKTNSIVGTIPVGTHPRGLMGTPDGKQLWVTNKDSSSISVIDTATLKVTATIALPSSQPFGIDITPDGTAAYVANGQVPGSVYVIDVARRSLT
jgi:YVTN family beta-propeller protein